MENKKHSLLTAFFIIAITLIVVISAVLYMQKTEAERKIAELENNAQAKENILLYNGSEILNKVGTQFIDLTEMEINDVSKSKYNTTYYNYENGKYEGTTI